MNFEHLYRYAIGYDIIVCAGLFVHAGHQSQHFNSCVTFTLFFVINWPPCRSIAVTASKNDIVP